MSRPEGTPNLKADQIRRIILLAKEGKTEPEIAKIVGCSETTVYNYKKKYNLL